LLEWIFCYSLLAGHICKRGYGYVCDKNPCVLR